MDILISMMNKALMLIFATAFAVLGVALPFTLPAIQEEELERTQEIEDVEVPGRDDPPEAPSWPRVENLGVLSAGALSQPHSLWRADAVNQMRISAHAHLSTETIKKLEEISHELSENLFERREKEEAIAASLDALLDSLHASKSSRITGGKGRPPHIQL